MQTEDATPVYQFSVPAAFYCADCTYSCPHADLYSMPLSLILPWLISGHKLQCLLGPVRFRELSALNWRMTDTAGDHANQESTGPARHGRLQSLLQECGPAMASRFSRKARNLHFYSKLLRQNRSKKTCSPLDICLLLEGCSLHFSACFSSP